jgi:predicted permease
MISSFTAVEGLLRDLRFGFRALGRSPATVSVAILSIALGIGANTAIFSMLHAIAWRPLPVTDPGALVQIRAVDRGTGRELGIPSAVLRGLREQVRDFEGVVVDASDGIAFRYGGTTERVIGEVASADFYSALGVKPFLGRYFPEGADGSAWAPVAVLSYDFFRRRLNGDSSIIGQTVHLNGHAFEVIGVSARGFLGLNIGESPDVRIPMMLQPGMQARLAPAMRLLDQNTRSFAAPIARLRPGISREQAEAATQVAIHHLWTAAGRSDPSPQIRLLDGSRGRLEAPRWLERLMVTTLAGTVLVLLIACMNVTNLFVARAAARQREYGVRLALGASRWQLSRQLLMESFLIVGAGALLGLLVAGWGSGILLSLLPQSSTPIVLALDPDSRVLMLTGTVTVFAALLFGIVPALYASRADPLALLKADVTGAGTHGRPGWTRRASVVTQVALTPVLLVGAGLLSRDLRNVQASDPGYDGDQVLMFSMKHVRDGGVFYTDAQLRGFFRDLPRRVEDLPAIMGASVVGSGEAIAVPGTGVLHGSGPTDIEKDDGTTVRLAVMSDHVSPTFFSMFDLQPLAGRIFTDMDDDRAPMVAVISETLARDLWGEMNPVGRRIRLNPGTKPAEYEVVGVISSRRYDSPYASGTRVCLFPAAQGSVPVIATLAVKVKQSAAGAAVSDIRNLFQALDPNLPVFNIRSATMQRNRDLARERLAAVLFGGFGVLALLLAAIGLYGVIAHDVARRLTEIAIRMALGAEQRAVVRMIVGDTLRLILIGVTLGLPLAYAAARWAASELHGVPPHDPAVFLGTVLVITAVGAFAGWVPSRRAAKVNPNAVLRSQ